MLTKFPGLGTAISFSLFVTDFHARIVLYEINPVKAGLTS